MMYPNPMGGNMCGNNNKYALSSDIRGGAKKTGLSFLSHHESCVLGIFFGLYRLALPILNFRHVYLLLILKIFYY